MLRQTKIFLVLGLQNMVSYKYREQNVFDSVKDDSSLLGGLPVVVAAVVVIITLADGGGHDVMNLRSRLLFQLS